MQRSDLPGHQIPNNTKGYYPSRRTLAVAKDDSITNTSQSPTRQKHLWIDAPGFIEE
jgi:hypothetical protein